MKKLESALLSSRIKHSKEKRYGLYKKYENSDWTLFKKYSNWDGAAKDKKKEINKPSNKNCKFEIRRLNENRN